MYLIDESYFNGIINVPNLNEPRGESVGLSNCVNDKVRLFLENLLGYENFKELDSFILDGKLKDDAPEKWKNLVYGCEFEKGDTKYYFKGLLEKSSYLNKSLLAYYSFYHWHTDEYTQVVGTGEVSLNGKNATNVNPTPRLVRVWNDFVNMHQGSSYNRPNIYTHCGVKVSDYLGSSNSNYVSLIEFLNHNSEIYKGFLNIRFDIINQFGFIR